MEGGVVDQADYTVPEQASDRVTAPVILVCNIPCVMPVDYGVHIVMAI